MDRMSRILVVIAVFLCFLMVLALRQPGPWSLGRTPGPVAIAQSRGNPASTGDPWANYVLFRNSVARLEAARDAGATTRDELYLKEHAVALHVFDIYEQTKLQLDEALDCFDQRAIDIADVDQALRDLETLDPRQAKVVELRFFGGLTIKETAELLAMSEMSVRREWMTAKRWLQEEISGRAAT